jgi:signal transduction histidine kinase
MGGYRTLYSLSLAVYTFGALAFSALALSYWRERSVRRKAGHSAVLAAFTVVCAAAFLLSLAREWNAPEGFGVAQDFATALIPPLLVHLAYEQVGRRGWRWIVRGFYGASLAAAAAAEWTDGFEDAPAWVLGAAGVLGIAIFGAGRAAPVRTLRALFALLAGCAVWNLATPSPALALVPDYLTLSTFAVVLYYQERLTFFDVLVKRGAFFAVGMVGLSVVEPWRNALLVMPFWLAAPWIYGWMSRAIERVWLHRRYGAAEAERRFVQEVQGAANEADLQARAARAASEIFQTRARVGDAIELAPRPDGIPFLSDDWRLAESLSRTLAILRDNVRFRELTGRAELKALRAQINPHFLFNALNAIAGLIQTQPEAAEETVEQLAEVFRYTLHGSDKEWVRLDEEMEFVAAYLGIERARFGDRLAVEIEIAPEAAAAQIPAMSIQPLVENAIKHGTSAVERAGRVRVAAAVAEGRLRIEVTDNGPGFGTAAPEGHGLRNVGGRLAGYYGAAARLDWENLVPGARVWIELPVGKEARCGS